ncbi:GFA family protein [Paludibacterium paludis]|uniref:Aldehyde-activating protein n=1 Tax=Paludibacterium paludis TaxID=1225769 RepID=A0A918UBQ5_9NEIS|nr:GFA family protein [Paludibacterium paludis]GGY24937.1 aldehyde-activating protein [Paludibacterium paludis]
MSDSTTIHGHCLCKAVSVSATPATLHAGACHCGTCRAWGGGPLLSFDAGTTARFEGKEHIAAYDSSAWAERGFCKSCGTHLFYRVKETGQCYVPTGLFPDARFVFDHQIYIDKKPDWYAFAGEMKTMTEAEVMQMYAPPA